MPVVGSVLGHMSPSLFMFVIFAGFSFLSHAIHVVMPPLPGKFESIAGPDAAIIIIPETDVPHTDYRDFGGIIQKIYPLRLWVSLLDISKQEALSLDNLPLLLGEAMEKLNNIGMNSDTHMFLAAHGFSGHVAADYSQAVPSTLFGLILMGTFLPKRFNLETFPLPVLTLMGELDGVVRITRLSQIIQSMINGNEADPNLITRNPVALLKGANHNVFTQEDLPRCLYLLDIEAEVDKSASIATASNITAIFISSILKEPQDGRQIAEVLFEETFEEAKKLTQPIRSLMEVTESNFKSYWVKTAQKWLSGLVGKHSTQLEVEGFVGQASLPPALVKEHGISYVISFSDVIYGQATDDGHSGMVHQAPDEIAARMLGPEKIHEQLEDTSIVHNYTCRDLNYASFMTAYHTASDRARERYNNYHRGVIFQPDVITDSEALWESSKLKMEVVSHVLHVTSISYRTANEQSLGQYAGLFFCKLLPPDRALEWIYVDSLRRSVSKPHQR